MNIEEQCNVIGIDLPQAEWDKISIHSSFTDQSKENKIRNKFFTSWGVSILISAYAVFLYSTNAEISAGELSKKLATVKRGVAELIHKHYNLEEYVKKSSGEEKNYHIDVVYRIITLLYLEKDFRIVYSFLLPWFKKFASTYSAPDYKTIIQEYAQAIHLAPKYTVVSEEGPAHSLTFTVRVDVGNQSAIGVSGGKKKAEKEAAKAFIEQYSIQHKKKKSPKVKYAKLNRSYTEQRKKQLLDAAQLMKIPSKSIRLNQLDEIFTHSSYVFENSSTSSNDCLNVIGAYLLEMLCYEYLLEQCPQKLTDKYKQEAQDIIKEENLEKAIPVNVVSYMLASKGVKNNKTDIIKTRIKISIFKATIAALWINYLDSGSVFIEQGARRIAYDSFVVSSQDIIRDYRTALHEVVQNYNFRYDESYKTLKGRPKDNPEYLCTLSVSDGQKEFTSLGQGNSKRVARNSASNEMLLLLLPYCFNTYKEIFSTFNVLPPEIILSLTSGEIDDSSANNEEEQSITNPQETTTEYNKKSEDNDSVHKEVSFDNNDNILYICKGTISCRKHNHRISSVTGILASLSMNSVKINVNFCENCKMYFIDYYAYQHYRDIYGILLGNFLIYSYGKTINNGYSQLADESVLKICGYTVNQADKLSSGQRHLILSNLIDRKIIDKYRIIEYLQFFINNSRHRYNMKTANRKWTEDLEWVRSYKINEQRHFIIHEIKNTRR